MILLAGGYGVFLKESHECVTECMEQHKPIAWVGTMNSILHRADEIVLREMICEEDAV